MNSLNLADQNSFNAAVNQVATFMLILGCISAFLSYTYTTCGMISAENQAIRLRKDYFKALLRQDMSWIDVNQPGEAASRLAEDTVTFQVSIIPLLLLGIRVHKVSVVFEIAYPKFY